MNEDLENEIEAINSIYGDDTLVAVDQGVYVLNLPKQDTSFRVQFPEDYPDAPLTILGTQKSGENARKGQAAYVLDVFRDAVGRLFQPGEVCLYDVIEDVMSCLDSANEEELHEAVDDLGLEDTPEPLLDATGDEAPPWTVSDVVVEMKSVFVARCAPVTSPDQAKQYLQHLLDSDKKVAKATHNITAHRIKGDNGATYQDCDDDGESAAGGRLLHLMQLMDLWNVTVVVTRWYGGQKLGPARFGIINTVARDAFVKGGFVHEQEPTSGKKRGKR
ncbi:hypothetical protein VF21_04746 [Pseudogymnoascus sp. 05NY08]|nr:hypothetical protein VF21_04746 [Pseudogymnoascus sp. 05NY08]